jgi:hypothetical protein
VSTILIETVRKVSLSPHVSRVRPIPSIMPQIGIFILVHIFSAVLPQDDPENDGEFYDILGLDKGATTEQIRKAYKKKSLALHPDKIAQRRSSSITKEQAAAEYEKVQEAYGVLMNDDKRQRYHALQCSVTRYKFVSKGTLANPGALLENLSKSSFVDKTRLVALCSILLAIVWIQPVLVATKINHVLEARGGLQDTKWVVIGLPFFLLYALMILFWSGIAFLVPPSARLSVGLSVAEHVLWYVAMLRLARAWDGAFGEDVKYGRVFIPVYLALIVRWMQAVVTLHTIRADVNRMISLDFLEEEVLKGKHLEELTEDERLLLMKEFLLVTVPPDFEPEVPEEEETATAAAAADIEAGTAEDLKKKNIEEQKVASSPEYEAATEMYNETFGNLISSIVFGSIFVLLVVLKLDGPVTRANWWTVFTPIWVYLGSLVMYYTSACFFGSSVTGDEIVLVMQQKQQDKEKQDNEDADNPDKSKDGGEEKEEENTNQKEQQKTATASHDETPVSPKDPRHDSTFVEADASVGRFYKAKGKNNRDGGEDAPEDEKEQDEKRKTSPKSSKVGASESIDNTASNIQKEDSTSKTKATNDSTKDDEETKKGDGAEGEGDEDDDDDDPIRLDEESFKAFQSAYAAAEQNAMEEQAKASSSCCTSCFQLLMLCLVVAKLDKAYDAAQDGDTEDVGFNTYWILFPFLLFCGLLCCICACLIYGVPGDLDVHGDAGEDGADSRPDTSNGGNNDSKHDEERPSTMIIPPPPPPASSTNTTAESPSQPASKVVSADSDNKSGDRSSATETKQNGSIGSLPMPDVQHASSSLDDLD